MVLKITLDNRIEKKILHGIIYTHIYFFSLSFTSLEI